MHVQSQNNVTLNNFQYLQFTTKIIAATIMLIRLLSKNKQQHDIFNLGIISFCQIIEFTDSNSRE